MREIKFRGYSYLVKEWVYGYLYNNNDQWYIGTKELDYMVVPESIGEFTGKVDCNDKEIYEGDIVTRNYFSPQEGFCVVFFDDAAFLLDNINSSWFDAWYSHERWGELEVVGNIYESPEILE